ncbi:MAG: DNA-binding protein, partial [Candidatus Hecatellales archaeon]
MSYPPEDEELERIKRQRLLELQRRAEEERLRARMEAE